MKLKTVRVRMYCNILDSTEVSVQANVTCLVGKNESGKTAFLQALWRMNPARLSPSFSVQDHYPAWLEKKHRNEGKDLESICPVEAIYAWEPADEEAIAVKFGKGVAPINGSIRLSKNYCNKFVGKHGCNEKKAVANFISGQKLPKEIVKTFKGLKSFNELEETIESSLEKYAEVPDTLAELNDLNARRKELLEANGFDDAVWIIIKTRIPQFFYFAEYSRLPYTVEINRIFEAKDDELDDNEATARALLRLGGAEEEYMLNPDYERRKRELENVANALTDDVLKYWSQNPELRVQPEITHRTEQRQDGQHSVLDELKVRIWDNRHLLSLPFAHHSAGFQWFFSFLVAFSEYEHLDPPVIILLDEPAIGLHAKAQADFLRFIEERLTKRCQVIYTTHSPFMVQPGHLERVRIVEDRGKEVGSIVSSDVLSSDPDTLFPLQGALGYDLVQNLFVAEHNLVVEGTSDYTYLRVFSDHLASLQGRQCLDPLWSIVPVGGADAIPTFVALLGNHLNVTVVVDSRKEGHQRLNRLAAEGFLAKQRVITIGDVLGQQLRDIEDLFSVPEYLELYNLAFGESLKEDDLQGNDPIVSRITRHIGTDRFDHGRPADILLRERDRILPKIGQETLKRFESLFERINKTLQKFS